MTNAEHLIENAMQAFKKDLDGKENDSKNRQSFFSSKTNINMANEIGVNLKEVWRMASYVWTDWLRDPSTIDGMYKELGLDKKKKEDARSEDFHIEMNADDALGYEIAKDIAYSGITFKYNIFTRGKTVYSIALASTSIYMVALHYDKNNCYTFISDIYPKSNNFGKTFTVPGVIISTKGDTHKYVNKTADIRVYDLTDGFYLQIITTTGEEYMVHMARHEFGKVIGEVKDMNSYIDDKMIGFLWYADYTTRNDWRVK